VSEITQGDEGLLAPVVHAIIACRDGYAVAGRPYRRIIIATPGSIQGFLAERVEALTNGRLTVCVPEGDLLYEYVQGSCCALALCMAGTANPVTDRAAVIQAWYLTSGGLLPAAFDRVPDVMIPYARIMNGME
jgi:hypothetical protein